MATYTYAIATAALTAVAATYATSPANSTLTLKKVTVTNTSGVAVNVTLYKVPSAGAAGTSNLLASGLTIPPNTVNGGVKEIFEAENQTLLAGETLQALAGTAGVLNLNLAGIIQTN